MMNNSSPDLRNPPLAIRQPSLDFAMEGVAASIKLLLKLIEDHKYACNKESIHDGKRTLRVATMITLLDNVRSRIHPGCQSRPNDDCSPTSNPDVPASRNPMIVVLDDGVKERRLRRELNTSLAVQKNLQAMCSSLGKEKDIIATELSRKVQELNGMEELVNDLKVQNEALLRKVQDYKYSNVDDEKHCGGGGNGGRGELQAVEALKQRNKVLSEQLLRSLEGYRAMKRKLKVVQEENVALHGTMGEILVKVDKLKEHILMSINSGVDEEINVEVESMLECLRKMVMKHMHDQKTPSCKANA